MAAPNKLTTPTRSEMRAILQVNGHGLYAPAIDETSVVLDLGANLGRFSSEVASIFGCSTILVEANPDLCKMLEQRGLNVSNLAVGAEDGRVAFNLSSNSEGSSVLPLPSESIYGATLERSIEVDSISLSTLLKSLPGPVDVLKLDVEGAEVAALNSVADEDLRAIGQITVEFHDDPSFQFHMTEAVTGVISRLEDIGFTCLQFNRPARTNALFLGPSLGLSATDVKWLRIRHDYWPALRHAIGNSVRR